MSANDNDSNQDGIIDSQQDHLDQPDPDLVEIKVHSLLPDKLRELPGTIKLHFDSSKIKIWKEATKEHEVRSDNTSDLDNAMPIGTRDTTWFNVNADIRSLGLTSGADLMRNHSFEFNHDAVTTWQYWQYVVNQTGVTTTIAT